MAAGPPRQQRHPRLAGPLTPPNARRRGRGLLLSTALVLALHALALNWFAALLRPPSLLQAMAPPFYTRSITPQTPPEIVVAAPVAEAAPQRPSAVMRPAPAPKTKKPSSPPKRVASAAEPAVAPEPAPPATEPPDDEAPEVITATPKPIEATEPTDVPEEADSGMDVAAMAEAPMPAPSSPAETAAPPAAAASDAGPAFLASWPGDTRLTYQLGGHYRGELHGSARVLWQREGTRYHTAVELDIGLLASLSFSSQGAITASGLRPEVYEEEVRGRRRGVRLGEDVRLNNGTRVPRPEAVQDTASQFVELGHRFATAQLKLAPGARIDFSMARPGGIDDWTYDVIAEETLHLPRLGPVATYHLRPRPLSKPRGPISAEILYAPSLQYLPVRIRITQGPDTWIDLLVDTVEQR